VVPILFTLLIRDRPAAPDIDTELAEEPVDGKLLAGERVMAAYDGQAGENS